MVRHPERPYAFKAAFAAHACWHMQLVVLKRLLLDEVRRCRSMLLKEDAPGLWRRKSIMLYASEESFFQSRIARCADECVLVEEVAWCARGAAKSCRTQTFAERRLGTRFLFLGASESLEKGAQEATLRIVPFVEGVLIRWFRYGSSWFVESPLRPAHAALRDFRVSGHITQAAVQLGASESRAVWRKKHARTGAPPIPG